MVGKFRALLCLAILFVAPGALGNSDNIYFECPCTISRDGNTLTVTAGFRSFRTTDSGSLRVRAIATESQDGGYSSIDSIGSVLIADPVPAEGSLQSASHEGDFVVPDVEGKRYVRLFLDEQQGTSWSRQDSLRMEFPVDLGEAFSVDDLDYLKDTDGDGVGDVNERFEDTDPDDPESVPDMSTLDVLAFYSQGFAELYDGDPTTRIQHLTTLSNSILEDSELPMRFRLVGIIAVQIDEDKGGLDREEMLREAERHGADLKVLFRHIRPNEATCGFAGLGGYGTRGYFSYERQVSFYANVVGNCGARTLSHEFGHVMGLHHSLWQNSTGTWRWSRGYAVDNELYTVMSYGRRGGRSVGVFSNPNTTCSSHLVTDKPCGVHRNETEGADASTSLNAVRFQIAAFGESKPDTDGDSFVDPVDDLPNDPDEWRDTDKDGIGNNSDPDDDGDGVDDKVDAFPLDRTETTDSDDDGVGDNSDLFPQDPEETVDSDGDGVGDNGDLFPFDPEETVDTDGDGVGDNGDLYPQDPAETADTDGDGIGDNADPDADNDGVDDNIDLFPLDATKSDIASYMFVSEQAGDRMGGVLTAADDDEGQTYIVVGASGHDTGDMEDAGAVYLISSADLETMDVADGAKDRSVSLGNIGLGMHSWKLVGEASGHNAGDSVATDGDMDGDGLIDVIVGANYYRGTNSRWSAGAVYFVSGDDFVAADAADGLVDRTINLSHVATQPRSWQFVGEANYDRAGNSVTSLGDIDGDGHAELIMGANSHQQGKGAAYLVASRDFAAADAADGILDGVIDLGNIAPQEGSWKFVGEESGDGAGTSIVSVGDFGGDGHADFAIGAPYHDVDEIPYVGAAYLVSITDLADADAADDQIDGIVELGLVAAQPDSWKIKGKDQGNGVGYNVSTAGDIGSNSSTNLLVVGSGNSTYIVSALDLAPADAADGTADGEVDLDRVYSQANSWRLRYLWRSAAAGDINGDGVVDLIARTYTGLHIFSSLLLADADKADNVADGLIYSWAIARQEGTWFLSYRQLNTFVSAYSPAGDVDDDGLTDILLGVSGSGSGESLGAVYLMLAADLAILDKADDTPDSNILIGNTAGDTDGDGNNNTIDRDDDNDNFPDVYDAFQLDPTEWVDTDGDRVGDNADAFPLDRTESVDTDGDGIGNNADTDDDNDGVDDRGDRFPLDPKESADTDNDGVGDNTDAFPLDRTESVDTDGDGIGNNADTDDDGDGVDDGGDRFPLDPKETVDTDGDGIGDNRDTDADGDGVGDHRDRFPLDPKETIDTDGDGIGDNGDMFPLDPTETKDTDNDGIGDNADTDADNDGVNDEIDAFPFDSTETVDTDGDGVGDNKDELPLDANETLDSDDDGVGDNSDLFPLDATKTDIASYMFVSEQAGDRMGGVLTAADDDEGQTFFVVGASGHDTGDKEDAGAVYLISSADLETMDVADGATDRSISLGNIGLGMHSWKIVGEARYNYAGDSVATDGDMDGDGLIDVIIGASSYDGTNSRWNIGAVYFVSGDDFAAADAADGLADRTINLSHVATQPRSWKFVGEASYDRAGNSVTSLGDMDGDGHAELIMGSRSHQQRKGAAYLVASRDFAAADAVDDEIDGVIDLGNIAPQEGSWKFLGQESGDLAGTSIVSAGDIGGDGHADFAIGAPFHDVDEIPNVGAAYLVSLADLADADAADDQIDGIVELGLVAAQPGSWKIKGKDQWDRVGDNISSTGNMEAYVSTDLLVVGGSYNTYIVSAMDLAPADAADGTTDGEVDLDRVYSQSNSWRLRNIGRSTVAGDINGDGVVDLFAIAYNGIHIFSSLLLADADAADYVVDGLIYSRSIAGQEGTWSLSDRQLNTFVSAYSPAGDVDDDGLTDILLGASGSGSEESLGAAYLLLAADLAVLDKADDTPDRDILIGNIAGDTDGDGDNNTIDRDDDNDNFPDVYDAFQLDPTEWVDTDGDRVGDNADAFPLDRTESVDTDGDGIGNNADTDDDNDGVDDRGDRFPLDPKESADTDNDGVGDNTDAFPLDRTESVDTDGDGIGNNADTDDDGDGVDDGGDRFPLDPKETVDTDGDGIGDNRDTDADGDGVGDHRDRFPLDPKETIDTDGDGIGDNGDMFPLDPTETKDTDNDGIGDNADTDADNDGVNDEIDAFPFDSTETVDTDGDGVGDNKDELPLDANETLDSDDDGVGDNSDLFPLDATKTDIASYMFVSEQAGDRMGGVLTAADDDEGQTFFVVGASGHDTGDKEDAGAVYLISSADLETMDVADGATDRSISLGNIGLGMHSWKIVGEARYNYAGDSVATDGDMDGDGLIDVIIGASSYDGTNSRWNIGAVYFVSGDDFAAADAADGLADQTINLSHVATQPRSWQFVGEENSDFAGESVAALGDMDGDGHAELIMGAVRHQQGKGAAYLVASRDFAAADAADGKLDGVIDLGNIASQDGSWKFLGEESGDGAGTSIVSVGDIGGDGHADFAIGAPYHDVDEIPYVGAAYLVSLADLADADAADDQIDGIVDLGLVAAQPGSWKIKGKDQWHHVGYYISSAGNMEANGSTDLLFVGSDNGTYIVSAMDLAPADAADGTADGEVNLDRVYSRANSWRLQDHWRSAAAGDINGDGVVDLFATTYNGLHIFSSLLLADADAADNMVDGLIYSWGIARQEGTWFLHDRQPNTFVSAYSPAGDVDDDGLTDILLGTESGESVDAVYLMLAADLVVLDTSDDTPDRDILIGNIAGDTDGDGDNNTIDRDDDNDNFPDVYDAFQLDPTEWFDTDGDRVGDNADAFPFDRNEWVDTDGDGIGNNMDTDDDGDGVADNEDQYPLDTDNDGIGNSLDMDDDGDGVSDTDDDLPVDPTESVDTDGDGTGDNADTDDDNDGVADNEDAFPLVPSESVDSDSDGVGDNADAFPADADEQVDTDGDGTGDNADTDDDNDGVLDSDDAFPQDSSESVDSDGDGIGDNADAFPADADEQVDTDGDGTGDNADTDDDNDGVADNEDAFPLDSSESVDSDGDGVGDNADAFPADADEQADSDGDGIGDNADSDEDNDGVADSDDAFPQDSSESVDSDGDGVGDNADAFPADADEQVDTDGDGIGDNADTDDDNDGVADSDDAFPLDSSESVDSDGDGIGDNTDAFPADADEQVDTDGDGTGDNADTDDDNDGVADSDDAFPLDSSESVDSDGDGVGDNADAFPADADEQVDTDGDGAGDNADTDDDNDGVSDSDDAFPLDSSDSVDIDGDGIGDNADVFPADADEQVDTDGDGIGDNADTDDDNDGVADNEDAFPLDSSESVDIDGDGVGDNADAFPADADEQADSDGDGIGDNADSDEDNDGVADSNDAFPLDSSESVDIDGDGIGDNADAFPADADEQVDTDGDGTGDNADTDDDNDGVADSDDAFPLDSSESVDSDGDGIGDNADAFPADADEQVDTDGDGTGDNADTDDDNDGVSDSDDAFPLDPSESVDSDGDGVGDNADAFPADADEQVDTDGDGTGDNTDTDDDNDGVADYEDALPLDSSESMDSDGDGVGDNADAFPEDAGEQADSDGDGIGDNTDTDDDNDGIPDSEDAFPLDAGASVDTDGDNVEDYLDAFPNDPAEYLDTDGDGTGDNADSDDDNDGVEDSSDLFPLDSSRWDLTSIKFVAEAENDRLGSSAAGVGDLDDDSRPEILVAASGNSEVGAVYLVSPQNLTSADEADGIRDGAIEMAHIATQSHSWKLIGEEGYTAGEALASLGDLDGDGVPEFVVGASALTGAVYLVSGMDLMASDAKDGASDGLIALGAISFGSASWKMRGLWGGGIGSGGLSFVGDTDDDGWMDILIGEPGRGAGDAPGRVNLISSAQLSTLDATDGNVNSEVLIGNQTVSLRLSGEATGDQAGASLAAADFDGDGKPDLLIGAPGHDAGLLNNGAVYLVGSRDFSAADIADGTSDSSVELGRVAAEQNSWKFIGEATLDNVGSSIATGDVDGDGQQDLILIYGSWNNSGSIVSVVSGSQANLAAIDEADGVTDGVLHLGNIESIPGNWKFTKDIYSGSRPTINAADVDGDDKSDLLIGLRYGNIVSYVVLASVFTDNALETAGRTVSLDDISSYEFYTNNSNSSSVTVAPVGDVDSDGLADFIIGEYWSLSGEAYLVSSADLPHLDAADGQADGKIYLFSIVRPRR